MTGYILTFLLGIATGAAGGYFASKFTDQRRDQEKRKKARRRFLAVKETIPVLIAEMQRDVRLEGYNLVREFFVLQTATDFERLAPLHCEMDYSVAPLGSKVFHYDLNNYPDLHNQIIVLENNGYVTRLPVPDGGVIAERYRMSEEFVEKLFEVKGRA